MNSRTHITLDVRESFNEGERWKLGIGTNPCVQTRLGKRCIYCGFQDVSHPLHPEAVAECIEEMLSGKNITTVSRVELYMSGSFFDDEEVSAESRIKIIQAFARTSISEIILESRPEFLTSATLAPIAAVIDPNRLTIAVGVETTNDRLRGQLRKNFLLSDVELALASISRLGMGFQAYLLLKSPGLESDEASVRDILSSANHLMRLCNQYQCRLTLAVQPLIIVQGTMVHTLFQQGSIRPPWLYTIALTLQLLDNLRNNDSMQIILGNEHDNLAPIFLPANYTPSGEMCSCSSQYRTILRQVNESRATLHNSIMQVLDSPCTCKNEWLQNMANYC